MILETEEEDSMIEDKETTDQTVYLLPNDLLPNPVENGRETFATKGLP